MANWAISYPLLQLGVKSTLDVIKQVTTTCNEYLNTPISADAIITLQEQSATVASMIRYILTYASTQEIFLKKSVSGAQNNSINSINT